MSFEEIPEIPAELQQQMSKIPPEVLERWQAQRIAKRSYVHHIITVGNDDIMHVKADFVSNYWISGWKEIPKTDTSKFCIFWLREK